MNIVKTFIRFKLLYLIMVVLDPICQVRGQMRSNFNQLWNPIRNLYIYAFWNAWELHDQLIMEGKLR